MNIGIYIYENAEVLDFSGPFEVFTTANRLVGDNSVLNVFLIADVRQLITVRGGLRVYPDYDLYDHPHIDVLIVSGGVHNSEMS